MNNHFWGASTQEKIVSFGFGKVVTKQEILDKLAFEKAYCNKNFQRTLRFFFHYGLGQMQFIDNNTQFRQAREAYKAQGFQFVGEADPVGITKEMIGAMSFKRLTYRDVNRSQDNPMPVDPLSALCGYATAFNEVVIYEINW